MRVIGRTVAVAVAVLAYVVLTAAAVVVYQVVRAPSPSEEFSEAVGRAWVDDGAPANVCGYPSPQPGETVQVTHEDIVRISECLTERGNLTPAALDRIRGDTSLGFTLAASPDGSTQSVWVEVKLDPVSRWAILVVIGWLAGLGVVVWFLGFRLWRRTRRST